MSFRGIDAGPPRRPLLPLDKDEKRALADVVRTMNTPIDAIEREHNKQVA